jgi:hypothetical protein
MLYQLSYTRKSGAVSARRRLALQVAAAMRGDHEQALCRLHTSVPGGRSIETVRSEHSVCQDPEVPESHVTSGVSTLYR